MYPEVISLYEKFCNEELDASDATGKVKLSSFRRYFESHLDAISKYRIHVGPRRHGYMIYDETFFSSKGASVLYSKLIESQSAFTPQRLRELVKEQCSMFPVSGKFDYRSLFSDSKPDITKLSQFNHSELEKYLERFAMLSSIASDKKKRLKLQMPIALLCNVVDHRSCFLQTLLGWFGYAHGLRDKGFRMLVSFGVFPSIRHIRNHGNHWGPETKSCR